MLKRGDKGPEVVALQRKLIALGYDLPRWGADGNLGGDETLNAVAAFLAAHAAETTSINDGNRDVVSDAELAFIDQVFTGPEPHPPATADKFFDLRNQSNRNNDHGPRSWATITGITLHQTACVLAENSQRMLNVGAHIVTGLHGQAWWLHGWDRIVWHGNGFNTHQVGIEMNGLYPGVKGDPSTLWNNPETPYREKETSMTDELVEVSVATCHYIYEDVARHGGKIVNLNAHRQASASRQDDPGSEFWERVGLRVMKELGLSDGGQGYKIGDGYAIPGVWDARYSGIKY